MLPPAPFLRFAFGLALLSAAQAAEPGTARFTFAGQTVTGVPEDDTERTTPEGKTSSVHFLHFTFTPQQIAAFRTKGTQVTLGITHPKYGHLAILPEESRASLAADFN